MKTLNCGEHLSAKALKEKSLKCFGVPASHAAALQDRQPCLTPNYTSSLSDLDRTKRASC